MSCLMVVDLICPKCGGPVVWCNGGDVIYDFSSQFKATCPSCGYEDWESKLHKRKASKTQNEITQKRKIHVDLTSDIAYNDNHKNLFWRFHHGILAKSC